jgi:hypothetical protein
VGEKLLKPGFAAPLLALYKASKNNEYILILKMANATFAKMLGNSRFSVAHT